MPVRTASLRQRIQLLVAAFLVLFALDGALAAANLRQLDRAERHLARVVLPATEATEGLRTALVDQETGLRGYVITGQRPFLEPYEEGRAREAELVARLRRLLADDASRADLEELEGAVARWRAEAAVPEIAARERGDEAAAEAIVSSGVGRVRFDEVRARLDRLDRTVEADQRRVERRLEHLQAQLGWSLLAALGLAVAAALTTGRLLRRWVTEPLERLSGAVRVVADGALTQPLPALGPPELARLGADVERMRQRILVEVEDAVRAQEALAQRAPIVLTLREELAPRYREAPAGLTVAARFEPAEGVLAGDWYDLVDLGDGRYGVVVVDTSGHGPVAGVFALRAKELLLAALRQGMAPGDALGWVARHLGDTGESFVTCVAAEIDVGGGAVRYASAGHPPILTLAGDDGEVRHLGATGPLLGPLEGRWSTASAHLATDTLLAVYTDGLIEARGGGREEFGLGRLADVLVRHRAEGPEAIADACLGAVRSFSAGHRLADDLTLVVLART